MEGEAALLISLAPASAVDLTGDVPEPTYSGPDRIEVDGPMVSELVKAEDFENHMMWTIGLEEELPYSFATLSDPARLVIDLHLADLTAVADYDDGERVFAVEAFATESDTCVAVRADHVQTLCLEPQFGHPLTYGTAWIDDVPVIVGVVFDESVSDIDLVAVDGTLISEDAEEFSLVEIGHGIRAFAPRINPLFLREIRVLDAEGTLVLQAQVTV